MPHRCGKHTAREGSRGLRDAVNTTKGRAKEVRLENVQENKVSVSITEGTAQAAVIVGAYSAGIRNSEWAQCGHQ